MLREDLVHLLVHVIEDAPVIVGLDPGPHDNLHGTVGQIAEGNQRSRRLENTFIGVDQPLQYLTCPVVIVAIGDAERPLDAAGSRIGHIVHDAVRHAAVRNDNRLVVRRGQHRIEEVDLLDRTLLSLGHDVVARAERLEQQNQYAARKVLQRTAQCHADGEAGRSDDGQERSRLDAENADDDQQQEDPGHDPQHVADELVERRVEFAPFEDFVEHAVEPTDQPAADEIDDDGGDEFAAELHQIGHQRVGQIGPAHLEQFMEPVVEFVDHHAVGRDIDIGFGQLQKVYHVFRSI